MSDNKIEKLSTSIDVHCKKDELIRAFPRWNRFSTLHVFHQEQEIWTDRSPSGDLLRFLDTMKKRVPTLGYVVEKREAPSDYYIEIEKRNYDVWNTKEKEVCKVEVTSWTGDIDQHYERVEQVKAFIIRKGFKTKTDKCEVTKVIAC